MPEQPKQFRLDVWDEPGAVRTGTILSRNLVSGAVSLEQNGEHTLAFRMPYDAPGVNLLFSRQHVFVYDIEKEAQGAYTPRKFRLQSIVKAQDNQGKLGFDVIAEHIMFDMLAEQIPEQTIFANALGEELLSTIMVDSAFTKGASSPWLTDFIVDEFTLGGTNRLDVLRSLAEKVDGELKVTDAGVVTIEELSDPEVAAAVAFVNPRYNLLDLQIEDDSRRLVTRMFGIGGGEPRLNLGGTWHPVSNSSEGPNTVSIHKLAPSDDAFEPLDSGSATVQRYFLEFRIMKGVYWPILSFRAKADLNNSADLVTVEIRDLSDLVGWTQVHDQLKTGDFCRLWHDGGSQFTGGWESQGAAIPLMNPYGAQAPINLKAWADCHKLPLSSNNADRWVSCWAREGNQGIYAVGNSGNFFYWDDGHAVDDWSVERNEAAASQRPGRPAYHPDYGLTIVGHHVTYGWRSRKIPIVDHYTVDAGSDETDPQNATDFGSPPSPENGYTTHIVRRADEFVAVCVDGHASAPYSIAGALRKATMGDLAGSPAWTAGLHVLNADGIEYLPESTAAHPGGAGLDPQIHDVFLRCDNELGGGLHYLLRYQYNDAGPDQSSHFFYQYEDNPGEFLSELDNFYLSDNTNKDYGYGILAVKRNEPAVACVAVWEHTRHAANNHDMKLRIYRRTGPEGLPGIWLFEDVDVITGRTDAQFNNWLWNNTISNGKGNTTTRVNVDYAFDDQGNEHIVYSKDDGAGNKNVYYRSRDNSLATPVWSAEEKISNGTDWDEVNFSPACVALVRENGFMRASAGSYVRAVWSARDDPSVFNTYMFIAGATFGEDPGVGDGTSSVGVDIIVAPEGGYETDCAGNDLPLQKVKWIEERDTTNVPAVHGYELHGWVDGITEQGDLEYTENLFDDGFLSRLPDYPSGLHEKLGDIGNGTPTLTKNTDTEHISNGQLSQRVQTTNADEGVYIDFDFGLAANCSEYFSIKLRCKLIAGRFRFDVTEGDRASWATHGTQQVFPPVSAPSSTHEAIVLTDDSGVFRDIEFAALKAEAGNDGRIWIYQDGATASEIYIDSVQIEPLAAPSEAWYETSSQRLLWSACYDELIKVNGIKKLYRLTMRDLFLEGINPYTEFNPGDVLQVENQPLDVDQTKLVVTRKVEDLLDPGGVQIDLASRLERIEDHIASAFVELQKKNETAQRSVRKLIKERYRLGPPKIGMVVRPEDKTFVDIRTQILDGTKEPTH